DLVEQAEEQVDVAVDQVEPALVRLAAQAGRDDDHVTRRHVLHAARADALVAGQTGALEQVEGLTLGRVLGGVDQADAARHAAALQREARHAADQAAAADDAHFHGVSPLVRRRPRPTPPSPGP